MAGVVLALSVTLLSLPLAGIFVSVPVDDEFVVTWSARRVAEGGVPYRDFWLPAPPGASLLHAALYGLTGPSQLASRVLACAAAGAVAALAWLVLVRGGVCARLAALVAATGALIWVTLWPYPTAHAPSVALLFATLAVAAPRTGGGASRRRSLTSGALAGAAGVFQPEAGLAALGGLLVLASRRAPLLRPGAMALGACLAPLSLGGWFLAHGVLGDALAQLWWPLSGYRRAGGFNDVAVGSGTLEAISTAATETGRAGALGTAAVAALMILSLLLGAGLAAPLSLARHARHGERPLAAALGVAALVLAATQLLKRPDLVHLAYASTVALPAAAIAPSTGALLRRAVVVASAAGGAAALTVLLLRYLHAPRLLPAFDRVAREQPRVRLLRELTRPDDRIVVLPAGGIYYSYARPAGLGRAWLTAPRAHYHGDAEYRAAAADLDRHAPALVVFETPREMRDFLDGSGPLAETLQRDYRLEGAIGPMQVLRRVRGPGSP